ncbi:SLC13 family permease [Campylobacter sp. MG1]|uniref:SLC13 family permease n=1 Tax=Campylobacter sp. MG1 TaxID=2976332 RepID=UPI00226C970D|nr:SLC13 family permease [Campylobacter sp. MG1]
MLIKKIDFVLIISFVLALFSLILNFNLNLAYESINFKTIILLFIFMLSLKTLELNNTFIYLANKITSIFKSNLSITFAITNTTFFLSMFITNDVALIILIPFTLYMLQNININKILILSLQTIAANLGSSLSPFGNPQNIFIYTFYSLNLLEFIKIIYPYVLLSFLLLNIIIFIFFKPKKINIKNQKIKLKNSYIDYIVFLICILAVLNIVNINFAFIIVCFAIIFKNYKIFFMIDYTLLFTFIFLFIFVGLNIENLSKFLLFKDMVFNAILLSNFISNVPATLLLHNFMNYQELLIGVNIGGLGTLISSMANLITFRLIKNQINRIKFLIIFSILNIIFLIILIVFYTIN